MPRISPQKVAVYFFAIVLPPVLLGVFLGVSSLAKVMIRKPPKPIDMPAIEKVAPGRRNVLILASNVGTEITDLASVAEVFGRAGGFNVFTAAPERKLSATTGPIEILPNFTLTGPEAAPDAEVLAVPSMLQWQDSAIIEAVRTRAAKAKVVLCLGEGARICALAGLLQGGRATSHFVAIPELEKSFKDIHWLNGPNTVEFGHVISSAGIMASIDAALLGLSKITPTDTAERVARELGHIAQDSEIERVLRPQDGFNLILQAAYNWNKQYVAVWLEPGASELGLASLLDTLPRTFGTNVFTLSRGRKPVRTRNGLDFVATEAMESVFPAEFLAIPPGSPSPLEKPAEDLRSYVQGFSIKTKDDSAIRPALGFDSTLKWLSSEPKFKEAAPAVPVVAKFIVGPYGPGEPPGAFNIWFVIRPLLVSILGVAITRIFERKFARAKAASGNAKAG